MSDASSQLKVARSRHLELHVKAYGKSYLKPKHHWVIDIADQLGLDPFVIDCFVLERLHRRAKTVTARIGNTKRYECTALAGVINAHRNSLLQEASPI